MSSPDLHLARSFVDGSFLDDGERLPNENPSDLDLPVGHYLLSNGDVIDRAIAAAERAQKTWSACTPQQRSDALLSVADRIHSKRETLGRLLALEEGKTLVEANAEIGRAEQVFRYFSGECLRVAGIAVDSVRTGVDIFTRREPVGVVAVITPWNFPAAIPAWKIAPALAYGNAVVFKPSQTVPATAFELARVMDEAGLPAGVFNLVLCAGKDVGEHLLTDRRVSAVTFTGSVATGGEVATACVTRSPMARMQLEMGGKNPLVVLNDADMEIAVATAVNGAFFSTGQRCTASSRLIVEAGIYDRFVEEMVAQANGLTVGHALDPDTQIGPVVSRGQLETNLRYVQIGVEEGAELVAGGTVVEASTRGHFFRPTVLANSNNDMKSAREEIFGPVASIIRADDYEHALSLANDTDFGLSAGICTQSLRHARDFQQNAQAGMVMVNLPTAGVDFHVPFGGSKSSSYGTREQGTSAIEFFTTTKTAYTDAGRLA